MFNNCYRDKRVLITGHTGFKGSWLTTWLLRLNANICGVSLDIPTESSMFNVLELEGLIEHHFCDVRDFEALNDIVSSFKPDFVFHLAAQAIVSTSYAKPLETISTNVLGTANIMESLRRLENSCNAVIITSDKCYENVEWEWGYKETDPVGGRDIYSGSKGAAEVIFHSYFMSFFNVESPIVKVVSARAGNVIGGGDWAKDRIVVDCMESWANGKSVEIRSPTATRPWQHVLEPLSGYLTLGHQLSLDRNSNLNGESFNFGPKAEQSKTVVELLTDLGSYWDFDNIDDGHKVTSDIPFHEAGLLKLNCDKALFYLRWEANLYYTECVRFVSDWYYRFYRKRDCMLQLTHAQIAEYEKLAVERSLIWTKS
jgi:CDP-glucose 4,6-dehydratase